MRGVVGWLHPDSRFAFQRQVHQTHRTHRTQGIIFADVVVRFDQSIEVFVPAGYSEGPPSGMY